MKIVQHDAHVRAHHTAPPTLMVAELVEALLKSSKARLLACLVGLHARLIAMPACSIAYLLGLDT